MSGPPCSIRSWRQRPHGVSTSPVPLVATSASRRPPTGHVQLALQPDFSTRTDAVGRVLDVAPRDDPTIGRDRCGSDSKLGVRSVRMRRRLHRPLVQNIPVHYWFLARRHESTLSKPGPFDRSERTTLFPSTLTFEPGCPDAAGGRSRSLENRRTSSVMRYGKIDASLSSTLSTNK